MDKRTYFIIVFGLLGSTLAGAVLGGGFRAGVPDSGYVRSSASTPLLPTTYPIPAASPDRGPTPVKAQPTVAQVVLGFPPPATTMATTQPASSMGAPQNLPELRQGFKVLADRLGAWVGQLAEGEYHEPESGRVLQRTTTGIVVWLEASGRIYFTDGPTTWTLGPDGLVYARESGLRYEWEDDPSIDPAIALPQSSNGSVPSPSTPASYPRSTVAEAGLAGVPEETAPVSITDALSGEEATTEPEHSIPTPSTQDEGVQPAWPTPDPSAGTPVPSATAVPGSPTLNDTPVATPVPLPVPQPSATPAPSTNTPVPPSSTSLPPTNTPLAATDTPLSPTDTPVPPTDTAVPPTPAPTNTPVPPTNTPVPPTAAPTATPVPPTHTPKPSPTPKPSQTPKPAPTPKPTKTP